MHERARNCMLNGMRSGRGQGLIAFQIVRTYLDTQSSIEQDYLPSFLLGNKQQWCKAYKGYQPRVRVEFDRAFQLSLISPHLEQFRTYLEHLSPMPISRISITGSWASLCICAGRMCCAWSLGQAGYTASMPCGAWIYLFGCWCGLTGCGWAGCLCLMFLV